MRLEEQIENDYITAFKARETQKVDVLRLLKSAMKNEAIKVGGLGTVLTDQQVMSVINREVKQRHDSISQYSAAGRAEAADKEKAELAILEGYLPKAMDEAELQAVVEEVLTTTGAKTRADMGKVMGELRIKLSNPADISKAASLVSQKLQ